MDKEDPTGLAFGLDDAIGTGVGAVAGVAIEVGADLISGDKITLGKVVGAAVQGGVYGEAAVNTPETAGTSLAAAGAVAGAAGNLTQQGIDNATGAQHEFSGTSLAVSTGGGAAGGAASKFIPAARVAGVTAGRGSFKAVVCSR